MICSLTGRVFISLRLDGILWELIKFISSANSRVWKLRIVSRVSRSRRSRTAALTCAIPNTSATMNDRVSAILVIRAIISLIIQLLEFVNGYVKIKIEILNEVD